MLAANLVALAALHSNIIVIQVVELNLYHLDLRVLGQDLVQHLGAVVEREAHMADPALGFQRKGGLVGAAGLELFKIVGVLGVHQVKIKVVHAAGLQLAFKKRADVSLGLEIAVGQLVGQTVGLAGVAAGQTLFQGQLTLAANVTVGGVKIVESLRQKLVHHAGGLGNVHLVVVHRQAHTAKAEILFHFIHLLHYILLLAPFCKRRAWPGWCSCRPAEILQRRFAPAFIIIGQVPACKSTLAICVAKRYNRHVACLSSSVG